MRWPCDKTEPLSHLLYPATKMLLLRPPRFDTGRLFEQLGSYFSGDRDEFEGSWLAHKRKPLLRERPAPVVSINLANLIDPYVTGNQVAIVQEQLQEQLEQVAIKHSLSSADRTLGELLSALEEQTQRRPVLLLDNYDAPIIEASVEHRRPMEDFVGSLVHDACFVPLPPGTDLPQQQTNASSTDVPTMRRQLVAFYRQYNPQKLHGPHGLRFADMVLRHFDFQAAALNEALHQEYAVDLRDIQSHGASETSEQDATETPLSGRRLHYMLVAGCFRHRHPLLAQCLPPENATMRDITLDLQFNSLVGLTQGELEMVLDSSSTQASSTGDSRGGAHTGVRAPTFAATQAISGGYWWGGVSKVQGNNVEYVHHPFGVTLSPNPWSLEALSATTPSAAAVAAAAAAAVAAADPAAAATAAAADTAAADTAATDVSPQDGTAADPVAARAATAATAATAQLIHWGAEMSAPASAALPWQQFWTGGAGAGASSVVRALTVLQDMHGTFVGASVSLPSVSSGGSGGSGSSGGGGGDESNTAQAKQANREDEAEQWPILLLQAGVLTMGDRAVWIHEFQTSSQVLYRSLA
jgi:hypothetical protein